MLDQEDFCDRSVALGQGVRRFGALGIEKSL